MFKLKKHEDVALEEAITRLYRELSHKEADTEEYTTITNHLTTLYALRDTSVAKRVSPDTLAAIGANLFGILLIVGHERANVITSKAMSLVRQAR